MSAITCTCEPGSHGGGGYGVLIQRIARVPSPAVVLPLMSDSELVALALRFPKAETAVEAELTRRYPEGPTAELEPADQVGDVAEDAEDLDRSHWDRDGWQPRVPHAERREAWYLAAYADYLRAEEECRGVLLSSAGERAGADPFDLWEGSAEVAYRYASRELRDWWAANGRLTPVAMAGGRRALASAHAGWIAGGAR